MNFLALVIISDFDDYFFLTVADEPLAKLIEEGEFEEESKQEEDNKKYEIQNILKIRVTSSVDAQKRIEGNKFVCRQGDEGKKAEDR